MFLDAPLQDLSKATRGNGAFRSLICVACGRWTGRRRRARVRVTDAGGGPGALDWPGLGRNTGRTLNLGRAEPNDKGADLPPVELK